MLKKVGLGWEFESESILEDFIWNNLESFFDLIPIARQYRTSNNQICDLLEKTKKDRLVILELTNIEDRYIVQQLTRYYDDLKEEKPFADKIDYQKSVKLVAVTPSFHRDNFTDIKYHKLDFDLWQFNVIDRQDWFYLQVVELDSNKIKKIEIPYIEIENNFAVLNILQNNLIGLSLG